MKFIFFGNMSFSDLPQREHAFALGLAEKGHEVIFIEGMPSFAAKIRNSFHSPHIKAAVHPHPNLKIYIPPLIPTMFRSSYTPIIDRYIFHRWMKNQFAGTKWDEYIAITTLPYWWYGFVNRSGYPFKKLIYDSCDSLLVPSRTLWALERMKRSETHLLRESDAVLYSAHTMKELYAHYNSFCITNAVSKEFVKKNIGKIHQNKKTCSIIYIGSIDTRWIDSDLLLYLAANLQDAEIHFYGPVNLEFQRKAKLYPHVIFHGFIHHKDIPDVLGAMDVAIIPFVKNEITDMVNPLKLYEYCSAGIPIVATRTEEFEYYKEVVYLAETKEDFIRQIHNAVFENTDEKMQQRIAFASLNTWDTKIVQLLEVIQAI